MEWRRGDASRRCLARMVGVDSSQNRYRYRYRYRFVPIGKSSYLPQRSTPFLPVWSTLPKCDRDDSFGSHVRSAPTRRSPLGRLVSPRIPGPSRVQLEDVAFGSEQNIFFGPLPPPWHFLRQCSMASIGWPEAIGREHGGGSRLIRSLARRPIQRSRSPSGIRRAFRVPRPSFYHSNSDPDSDSDFFAPTIGLK